MSYTKIYFIIKKFFLYLTISIFCSVIIWLLFYYIFLNNKITNIKDIFSFNISNKNIKPFIISGISDSGLLYYITSVKSSNYVQNIINKENISLQQPYFKVILKNGLQINSNSKEGTIDNSSKIFLMKNNVRFFQTEKKFVVTEAVRIDLQNKNLISHEPTFALYENIELNSKGFYIDTEKSYINIFGSYKIQTKKDKLLQISAKGNLVFDLLNKIIITNDTFHLQISNLNISAKEAKIWYINFDNLEYNLRNNLYSNFKRIELNDNITIKFNDSVLTADQYINDTAKNIMILRSKNNIVKYENPKIILTSNQRFEYLYKNNLLVARGKPVFYIKNSANEISYQISQDIISATIDNNNKIQKVESFDNITIKYQNTIIKADYVKYDSDFSTIIAEDNINIIEGNTNLTGCSLIINLKNNNTRLIPCENQEKLSVSKNNIAQD